MENIQEIYVEYMRNIEGRVRARTALATRLRQLGPGFGNRPWIRKLPGRFGYWPGFDNYLDLATEPPGWIWKLGSRRWIRKPVELDLATGPPGWIWQLGVKHSY